jgi:hypothetical protein
MGVFGSPSDPARVAARAERHASDLRYQEESHKKEVEKLQNEIRAMKAANPDPNKWRLVDDAQVGMYLIVKIQYPNCENHKGMKVLLYACTLGQLVKQGSIDPHFGEPKDQYIFPKARFTPDPEGWNMALILAKSLDALGKNASHPSGDHI